MRSVLDPQNASPDPCAFTRQQLDLLREATTIVDLLPVASWRCHEVARVVGKLLKLDVVDGQYGGMQHSWCTLEPLEETRWGAKLLDPYAVGRLPQVQLVFIPRHLWMPGGGLYRPDGKPRADVNDGMIAHGIAAVMKQWVPTARGVARSALPRAPVELRKR